MSNDSEPTENDLRLRLALLLRKSAREALDLPEGEHWPSHVAEVQARAVVDWLRRNDPAAGRPDCEVTASCEPGDHAYSWPCVHAPIPPTTPEATR